MAFEQEYAAWLQAPLTARERAELTQAGENPAELSRRFGSELHFGTAGIRARMAVGPGTLCRFTVRRAARAFGLYMRQQGAKRLVIGYDSRKNSARFSREAAIELLTLGFEVCLFASPRPTPLLSFAISEEKAGGGLCITGSHNDPDYNGIKPYNARGAQLESAACAEIERIMRTLDPFEIRYPDLHLAERACGAVRWLSREIEQKYVSAACARAIRPRLFSEAPAGFSVLYTPLSGVGGLILPQIFDKVGFSHVQYHSMQMRPRGDFPQMVSLNPEKPAAFLRALPEAEACAAAMILANDPDADRAAVMCRGYDGSYGYLSGYELGCLLCDYLLGAPCAPAFAGRNPDDYDFADACADLQRARGALS